MAVDHNGPMATHSPATDIVQLSPQGLYCPAGGFHIDPWKPVPCAVITHGHGDHAREGMGCYHFARPGQGVLQWRLGDQVYYPHEYGETFTLGDAKVSLHSAGHVLGSAQVRIEVGGEVWVASGDYKRQNDPTCAPFEVVRCDTFITEATFGYPVYRWPDTAEVAREIVAWRDECAALGEAAILYGYSLGKAQRLLAEIGRCSDDTVWLHGAVHSGVQVYREAGIAMAPTQLVADAPQGMSFAGKIVLAPPSAAGGTWVRRFKQYQQGFASGWMRLRGNRRRKNYERGFVVSDHADWPDLLRTIDDTGARRIIATHGNTDALVRVLQERGLDAGIFTTPFGDEEA